MGNDSVKIEMINLSFPMSDLLSISMSDCNPLKSKFLESFDRTKKIQTEAKSHTEREIDHVGSRLGSKGLK